MPVLLVPLVVIEPLVMVIPPLGPSASPRGSTRVGAAAGRRRRDAELGRDDAGRIVAGGDDVAEVILTSSAPAA